MAPRWNLPAMAPRWNIAPTQASPVIRAGLIDPEQRRLSLLRWGLIPFWAKDAAIATRTINARAETAAEKPAFREAFRLRRALVPADGWYEWPVLAEGKRAVTLESDPPQPLAFAGLWDRWSGPAEAPLDVPLESFTILTGPPEDAIATIHDRMPLVLPEARWAEWLDPATPPGRLQALLLDPRGMRFTWRRVDPRLGNVRLEGPSLLLPPPEAEAPPVAAKPGPQGDLFG